MSYGKKTEVPPFCREVVTLLQAHRSVVLHAPPGSGKTTRLPIALLGQGTRFAPMLVLEPRRMAARMAARYVASLLDEEVGQTVGYRVRFDDQRSEQTRVLFVTEGMLGPMLAADPDLEAFRILVFDEFHERHLDTDFGLALAKQIQQRRTDLRLVIMSATLRTDRVSSFLDRCPVVAGGDTPFPVQMRYAPTETRARLEHRVCDAVHSAVSRRDGDLLVFLPGAREIDACHQALAGRVAADLVRLHGSMPAAAQDRAVQPSTARKVVLATNVAETSITIPGITTVVDTGLARIPEFNPWTGLPSLHTRPVSQASADQRAGRAGRLGPGLCLRLYTEVDYRSRPAETKPEIQRLDLSDLLLQLHALGHSSPEALAWLDSPEEPAWQAARSLLTLLGALDEDRLTPTGRAMSRVGTHPRLARLLLEAARLGAQNSGALLAALLEDGVPHRRHGAQTEASSDLFVWLDALGAFGEERASNHEKAELGLPGARVAAIKRTARQLQRRVQESKSGGMTLEAALRRAVLAGFPDRVAQRRPKSPARLKLAFRGGARLSPASVVASGSLLVVTDVEQKRMGARREPEVRVATVVEPDWIVDLFPQQVSESREIWLDDETGQVEGRARLSYAGLHLLDERVVPTPEEASAQLQRAVVELPLERLVDGAELSLARQRIAFLRQLNVDVPQASDEELREVLELLVQDSRSLDDIRGRKPLATWLSLLAPDTRRRLDQMAPTHVHLSGGRRLPVYYEPTKPPWIASYLQDFFGCRTAPLIAGGRVPLTIHLWAPNRRAVQVTTDIGAFWQKHYPSLRKQLQRRYPKHDWPEDPSKATPQSPAGPRSRRAKQR